MKSDAVKTGMQQAPHRSLFNALGMTEEEMRKPLVGIVSSYNEIVPGHMNLDKIVDAVKLGVAMAGGTPVVFPAIAVCDGIAMGHIGMKYSLVTRDLIADSTECMALAHQFDALVMVPNCDKNVPGLLMAAARINVPTVFVSGGPMLAGHVKGHKTSLSSMFEAVGAYAAGNMSEEDVKEFKKKGIPVDKAYISDESGGHSCPQLWENQFLLLKADQSVKKTLLGRVQGDRIVPLEYKKSKPYGISPKNSGQYFLQEALMQPADKAPLVIVKGMAGTAKTFYSLAVGLEKLLNNPTGEYRRIIISRPNAQFDADIGFLPGDEQEKISPLMRPVIDNLEQLIDSNEEKRYEDEAELKGKVDEIFDRGLIQTEALNYIRGRSIVKTYLIIDEAQNMTPNQVKGIITRAGMGTKVILLGDPNQIDRTFLDERTNGLSYASEHMKGSGLCWQITLNASECERSELAMDAVRRL